MCNGFVGEEFGGKCVCSEGFGWGGLCGKAVCGEGLLCLGGVCEPGVSGECFSIGDMTCSLEGDVFCFGGPLIECVCPL